MPIQFKFINISPCNHKESQEELNSFLRSHRILTVHREFVSEGTISHWCFAVEYLEGSAKTGKHTSGGSGKSRIDYKEVLTPEDFAIFATLREWRKEIMFSGSRSAGVYNFYQ